MQAAAAAATAPPPPYSPHAYQRDVNRSGAVGAKRFNALPLHLVHRILSLTLDQRATPSRFWSDPEEERVRRIWALFRGLRGVNRTFWLVATSILRAMYLEPFLQLVKPGYSSDPFPYESSHLSEADGVSSIAPTSASNSIYASRGRETAVFDRFIAVRIGQELRKVESELSEEGEQERDIFTRLQPAARIEDLLLTLPQEYITSSFPTGYTLRQLPLSHSNISVTLTPSWVQLYLHTSPTRKGSKELVLEVRRTNTLESNVKFLQEGLDSLRRGLIDWGGRVG